MARNDVYININALSPADAVVTGQQDMTAATVPELVLGDTPTFNFLFTDNTNVWPSWAGNASYSLTWALSDAVAGDFAPAATTSVSTPITGGWSVVLPLNSYDLVGLLNTKRVGQPYPVTNLWQQLRVTDPSGNEITRAMFWTPVRYRAISDTQNTESATPTGGRIITTLVSNALQNPTAAQFYAANPVPTSALGTAANGELLIGNGTGFTKSTLTAGTGITVTNGSGTITIDASGAQETLTATVKNAESVAITKGQVVYLFGATGGFASVKLAYNTSDATSAKTFGVVSSTSIAANGTGTVTCVGVVDGLNLGAYNDGDTLYLGATPGSITATKPYAPNHLVYVGIVERANNGNGELYVRVQNGYELDEIHDVQINAPKLAGQTLIYDQTNDLWKNARLTGTANQITVTNADAAVTLSIPTNPTLPGNLTVSGTGTSTFGGNLTVSGTGLSSVAGALNVTGALLAHQTAALNMAHEGSSLSQLVSYGADASTYGRLNVTLRKAGTGVGAVTALALTSTDATLAGNLTVSGTGTSTVSGGLNILSNSSATGSVDIGSDARGSNLRLSLNAAAGNDREIITYTAGLQRWKIGVTGTAESGSNAGSNWILQAFADNGSTSLGNAISITRSTLAATFSGNLTVSGGTLLFNQATAQYQTFNVNSGGTGDQVEIKYQQVGNGRAGIYFGTAVGGSGYMRVQVGSSGATTALLANSTGNLLVGTTIDSGNGKLQLATHTTSAGGIGFGTDVALYRSSANTLKLELGVSSGALLFDNGGLGTGGARVLGTSGALTVTSNGANSLYLQTGGTTALTLDSSQNATFSRQILAGAGFVLGWNGRGHLIAPSDGVITLLNAASTDFNRLQFGGTTASFPSLKRSTSVLTCVLADDSAFTTFRALDFSAQGAATTTGANQVSYGGTTATTATAGAQTLPANPVGFIIVNVAGTTAKIPYYAN